MSVIDLWLTAARIYWFASLISIEVPVGSFGRFESDLCSLLGVPTASYWDPMGGGACTAVVE